MLIYRCKTVAKNNEPEKNAEPWVTKGVILNYAGLSATEQNRKIAYVFNSCLFSWAVPRSYSKLVQEAVDLYIQKMTARGEYAYAFAKNAGSIGIR